MAFKGKMKKENEDDSKFKVKNKNYEVLDCSLALKNLTNDYNERIHKISRIYEQLSSKHEEIKEQINVFRDNLQHNDDNKTDEQ
mmetsp:Transcript_34732/g.75810  ORF Transcript_34732/g.75810 Transcript_34732/m.75810 type:complete len:84 (-) Transcript_34732:755-1006(-)